MSNFPPRDNHGRFLRSVQPASTASSHTHSGARNDSPWVYFYLLAMPFVFLGGLILGRWQILNRDLPVTRIGLLRMTQTANPQPLLLERNGLIYNLILPKDIDIGSFQNRQVTVNGIANDWKGTLTVASPDDIQLVSPVFLPK